MFTIAHGVLLPDCGDACSHDVCIDVAHRMLCPGLDTARDATGMVGYCVFLVQYSPLL
ncbi:MAG: hypothetical protein ACRESC_05415 [Gammaproteobacteria bacterium]